MGTFIIAEISNHHVGSVDRARELILAAKEAGADAVKAQAFGPGDITTGMMPEAFYAKSAMSTEDYLGLIDFGKSIGIPVFYSFFGKNQEMWAALRGAMPYLKLSASQTHGIAPLGEAGFAGFEVANCFASANGPIGHKLQHIQIGYATGYLEAPRMEKFDAICKEQGRRAIGYSDHALGLSGVQLVASMRELTWIEKHFFLEPVVYEGIKYRDSIHGIGPQQFTQLVRIVREQDRKAERRNNEKRANPYSKRKVKK